jgi:hypothetical protein
MTTRECSILWCHQKHAARGWCSKHYQRWLRYGNPLYLPPPRPIPTHAEIAAEMEAHIERRRAEAAARERGEVE